MEDQQLKVSGRVKSNLPVYAVVAYCDPEGGSDYDATTATAVPNEKGEFDISVRPEFKGRQGELRLVFLHVNGETTRFSSQGPHKFPFQIDKTGKLSLPNQR